ncbi:MAG: YggT family protein [Chloroflexota bacterium]|nr:YggT family protein [Chloroflexota bacterium]
MSEFLRVFFQLLVTVLWFIVVARILLSWINPKFEGPVARFLFDTTEPLIAPIRRVMPQSGTFDWAPLLLLLVLGVLLQMVVLH